MRFSHKEREESHVTMEARPEVNGLDTRLATEASYLGNNGSSNTNKSPSTLQENPFFKNMGMKHRVPKQRDNPNLEQKRKDSLSGPPLQDEEDLVYKPGSGFVHKLLDKFTSLTVKDETSTLKRSSSDEQLHADASKNDRLSKSDRGKHDKLPMSSKLAYSNRAPSIDTLHILSRKTSLNHFSHSRVDTRINQEKEKELSSRSPRDSHVEAPDVDFAREDIVIIETTPSQPIKKEEVVSHSDETVKSKIYHGEMHEDELPKPNTVHNVRSIFETAVSASKISKQLKSDSSGVNNSISKPLPVSVPEVVSKSPVTSPQVVDTHKQFVHTDKQRKISQESEYVKPKPEPPPIKPDFDVSKESKKEENVEKTKSISEQRSFFDRPGIPPRTASVKPTVSTKPNKPVSIKPVPISTPPSSTGIYKKSSPVVPVAPFKENKDDRKDDGEPVMIYQKKKSSPTRTRDKRLKDYTPVENLNQNKKPSELIQNYDKLNKVAAPSQKQIDFSNNKTNTEASDITIDTTKTTIEIKSTPSIATRNVSNSIHSSRVSQISDNAPQKDTKLDSQKKKQAPKPPDFKEKLIFSNNITKQEEKLEEIPKTEILFSAKSEENLMDVEKSGKIDEKPKEIPKNSIPFTPKEDIKERVKPETIDEKPKEMPKVSIAFTPKEDFKERIKPDIQSDNPTPIKGIPSIIRNKMKSQKSHLSDVASVKKHENSKADNESTPYPTKRPFIEPEPSKEVVSNEIENEIMAVRKKMESNRNKGGGVAQIFDSSQLKEKRKENKKRRELAAASNAVPRLDLSGVTGDNHMDYQGPQRDIKPCNIVFEGENAKTSRSLLKKARRVKVNIRFNDTKTETFEYPSEEHALELFLEEHPHDTSDILFLDEFPGPGSESSDDVEEVLDIIETPVTPRGNKDEDLLKSNTSLSHTSSFQSYRGRFQEDYEFGKSVTPEPLVTKPVEPTDSDTEMMLRPAEAVDSWSTNSTSDLLF